MKTDALERRPYQRRGGGQDGRPTIWRQHDPPRGKENGLTATGSVALQSQRRADVFGGRKGTHPLVPSEEGRAVVRRGRGGSLFNGLSTVMDRRSRVELDF